MMEGYTPLNSSAGNAAPVGGRRRSRRSRKGLKTHLRLVSKKTVRKMLAKEGRRMRGGASAEPEKADGVVATTGDVVKDAAAAMGGRRRRSRKGRKSSRRSRKVFGLF
jgi:hypothetical protein